MFTRTNLFVVIAFGILAIIVFAIVFRVNAQVIPTSIIRTPQDENGYYLSCEGECEHFNRLQLDNTLRFCQPYQAINYMYQQINQIDNLHLGPLTPYDNNPVC